MFFSVLLSYLAKGSIFLLKAHVQFSKCEGFRLEEVVVIKELRLQDSYFFSSFISVFYYEIHINVDSSVIVRRNTGMILISLIENISRERSIDKFFL